MRNPFVFPILSPFFGNSSNYSVALKFSWIHPASLSLVWSLTQMLEMALPSQMLLSHWHWVTHWALSLYIGLHAGLLLCQVGDLHAQASVTRAVVCAAGRWPAPTIGVCDSVTSPPVGPALITVYSCNGLPWLAEDISENFLPVTFFNNYKFL